MVDNFRIIDSKKFMWDGKEYESEGEAKGIMEGYEKEDFETHVVEEEGKWLVYTRRVVTEVVVDGAPPM
jgi:hypothetical protein